MAGFIQSAENFDAFVARYVGTLVEADQKKAVDAGHNVLWNVLSSSAEPSEGLTIAVALTMILF